MQETNYPEILQDLRDDITQTMAEQGIDSALATQIAHSAVERTRKNWGGMLIYICKGKEYELNQRDQEIWAQFTGNNHHTLCQRFGISLQRLYRIIAIQRQQDLKARQRDMFE